MAEKRAEARRKGGRHRRKGYDPSFAEAMGGKSFRSLEDVEALLEAIIKQTLALYNSVGRSRAIGYLVAIWCKAHETGDLEKRIERLEQLTERGRT